MSRYAFTLLSIALAGALGCQKDNAKQSSTSAPVKAASQPSSAPAKAVAPSAKPASQPTAVAHAGGDVEKGKSHYMRACAACHGLDGSGAQMRTMLPKIGNLTLASTHARLSDNEMVNLIKKGRGKMPALEKSLTEHQITQIVAYVRTLKKAE